MWSFSLFHITFFWDEIFCNMLLKIHVSFSIHYIFCINFSWITKNFVKVYKIYQIMDFVLKNYLNFKLYENMLIISFFYYFIKYNFFLDVIYITPHLHVVKGNVSNCECFLSVDIQLTSSQFFSHQNSFINKFSSLVIYKIDYF